MKKMINGVESLLEESLNGFAKAHQDIVSFNHQPHFISRKQTKSAGKVMLVSGGG